MKVTPLIRPTKNKTTKPKNMKFAKIKSKASAPQSKVKAKMQLTTKSLTLTTPTSGFGIDLSEDEAYVEIFGSRTCESCVFPN